MYECTNIQALVAVLLRARILLRFLIDFSRYACHSEVEDAG